MGPYNAITWRSRTEEQIEEWIVEWYRSEDFDGTAEPRMPPSWLAVWKRNEKSKNDEEA